MLTATENLLSQSVLSPCIDTSYSVQFESTGILSTQDQSNSLNGDRIVCGSYRQTTNSSALQGWILKTSKDYSVQFSKSIRLADTLNVVFDNIQELSNGCIFALGRYYSVNPSQDIENIVAAKVSPNGVLLWIQPYKISLARGFDNSASTRQISEDEEGNIYFSCHTVSSGYATITKVNAGGTLLWSKGFKYASNNYQSGFSFNGTYFKDSTAYLTAVHGNGYSVVRIGKQSGNYLSFRHYSIINQGFYNTSAFTQLPVKSRKIENGHYIVCSPTSTGSGGDLGLGAQYQVVELDTGFNVVRSYRLVAFPFRNTLRDIAIKANGDLLYRFFPNGAQNYYGVMGIDGRIKRQKKVLFNGITPNPWLTGSSVAADDEGELTLTQVYNGPAGSTGIQAYTINESNVYKTPCLQEIDTAFTTTEDFVLSPTPATFQRIDDNALTEQVFPVTVTDVLLNRQETCKQESICDKLKITGPDTVCVYSSPVQFTASKGVKCLKTVQWQLDSSAVDSINFVNDTTVQLHFKKPWSGYLHAGLQGCFLRDSIKITAYKSLPQTLLGADTTFCTNDSLLVSINQPFQSYAWSSGNTTKSITVFREGQYIANGYLTNGCFATDTINILPLHALPVFKLATSGELCIGQSDTLSPGPRYKSYLWQDGSREKNYVVKVPGTYSVQVKDSNGCYGTDTLLVHRLHIPPTGFLPKDTTICSFESFRIQPREAFSSYLWNTGSTQLYIEVDKPGEYILKIKDKVGCTGKDGIIIQTKECKNVLLFPSAFTPNDDGKNDFFKPFTEGNLLSYELRIYNRWGQVVFASNSPSSGWSGYYQMVIQPNEVFVYVAKYQFRNRPPEMKKGSFVLIK